MREVKLVTNCNSIFEIKKQYIIGQRDFQKVQLRRANLRGFNLTSTDFRGADLSYANLREVNLSYADLRGCYLNEANLIGANLTGANLEETYLIKAYLTRANLDGAILTKSYLTGAFLTKANLNKADLRGAFLNGADLNGAFLKGAYYNEKTCFDSGFNAKELGMEEKYSLNSSENKKVTVEELMEIFKNILEIGKRYLGNTLTAKYFISSRPEFDWLSNFEIDDSLTITFSGNIKTSVTIIQHKFFHHWIDMFIKNCSMIVGDFDKIVAQKQKLLVIENRKKLVA